MTDSLEHRIYGVAVTYQYLPTNKRQAGQMSYEEFRAWHTNWYKTFAPEEFTARPTSLLDRLYDYGELSLAEMDEGRHRRTGALSGRAGHPEAGWADGHKARSRSK